ncbi:glycosyltransferase [Stieleria sp. JC731]|uniref:glycosyltransferase family 2 protein n=1 Tax=Pirellulaceae TaxID=2691357 RepID=UPI001E61296E|nr:glycosyltransferase family 2 protein [Stieleria sp. JC731]MCC9601227.1 glycosyltransferase [Stieleria sp. JC731]
MRPRQNTLAPEVSVVMSCFNSESHLREAVDSICRQTLRNWELVAINDGSTDSTGKILDKYAQADPRIKVIHQSNRGLTQSLIRGCSLAKAELIARQDADDRSMPNRLQSQLDLLRRSERLGFVSCFANYVGPENELLCLTKRPSDPLIATQQLLNERIGPPAHGTVMFRKFVYSAVGGYRPEFFYAQDADLWLRMAEVSLIGYVSEPLYEFRFHPSSITGTKRDVQKQFGVLGQQCRSARKSHEDETVWLDKAAELSACIRSELGQGRLAKPESGNERTNQIRIDYLIGSQLVKNRDARGKQYLARVLRRSPAHVKAWLRMVQAMSQHFSPPYRDNASDLSIPRIGLLQSRPPLHKSKRSESSFRGVKGDNSKSVGC